MRTEYIGGYYRPDGYFGAKCIAHLAYDLGTKDTFEVYTHGFHRSIIPPCDSVDEVLWMIRNHPVYKKHYRKITA